MSCFFICCSSNDCGKYPNAIYCASGSNAYYEVQDKCEYYCDGYGGLNDMEIIGGNPPEICWECNCCSSTPL